jgi:hypothetical protein
MSKADQTEMTFVLLARDPAAPATIRFWANERVRLAKNEWSDPQIREALACANAMEIEYHDRRRLEASRQGTIDFKHLID